MTELYYDKKLWNDDATWPPKSATQLLEKFQTKYPDHKDAYCLKVMKCSQYTMQLYNRILHIIQDYYNEVRPPLANGSIEHIDLAVLESRLPRQAMSDYRNILITVLQQAAKLHKSKAYVAAIRNLDQDEKPSIHDLLLLLHYPFLLL